MTVMMLGLALMLTFNYSYAIGVISTIAGTGSGGYSGDGGAATSAQLNYPFGVALDSSGNVYIVDYSNNRIRMIDAISGNISTIAGTGSNGYSGDGGAATSAQLKNAVRVALDSSGNVYIADMSNHPNITHLNLVSLIHIFMFSTYCDSCDVGYFSSEGSISSANCTICPAGTYGTDPPSAECVSCPAGKFSSIVGSTFASCIDCPAGEYSNATGQAFCTSCPANTYNPSIGSDTMSCYPCKSGFEAKVGSPICCPRGTYVLIATTGASCQPCPRGYFPDTSSFTGCTACAAGTTADPYDYECRNCPSGYYSKGGSECLSCPSGKFSLEGNATCTDCPTDSFSNEGSAQCKSCSL